MAARFSKLTMNTLSRLNNYDNDNLVYCDTKLCNILFTQKLAKLLQDENVSVFSVHPGPVDTPIITGRWSPKLKFIGRILTRLFFLVSYFFYQYFFCILLFIGQITTKKN